MPINQGNNRRIAKNTLFLYLRMFIVLFINLYSSRVLLHALGVSDYGIYVLIASFVTLFGIFNSTLSSTMQRYFNYAGVKTVVGTIQDVFSTGIHIHLAIALGTVFLLETGGLWYLNNFLVIAPERLYAANILFHASTFSLFFTIMQIPATGLVLANERMSFFSFVSIIDVTLKLLAIISLQYLSFDRLPCYGFMLSGISIIDFFIYAFYLRYHFPTLKFSLAFRRKTMKSLLSFTGWNLMGTFAFMLKTQGLTIVLNNFFGPLINAARGIALQVSSAVGNFSSNISLAFAPQIVNSMAEDNKKRVQSMMFVESKICFAVILILVTPLCLEISYVLKLWLGEKVPHLTDIFSILVLIDTLICTLNTPCTQITQATGKVKYYQIGSTIVNISLIPVCYIFLGLGYSAISSFVITIIFSIINQIVCLFFSNQAFNFGLKQYTTNVLLPCLAITCIIPITSICIKHLMESSAWRLLIICISDVIAAIPACYYLILNKSERKIAVQFVKEKIHQYLQHVS